MKHLLLFSLLLLALLLPTTALAHDFEVDGIYYNINGNEATVTSSSSSIKYSGSVTIPATVAYNGSTYTVTTIGYRAFYDCRDLSSVSISYGVDSIGDNAFMYCTGLTSINIPISVTSIGDYAFNHCSNMTSIDIPNSVTSIGSDSFGGCYKLTSITIPNSVTSLGNEAFSGCSGLTSIDIPNSVTTIGDLAFAYCESLTSITIPNSVTHIGGLAFYDTPWYDNQPDGLVYAGLVAYSYKGTMPSGTSISLAEGTLGISASAFFSCSGLTSINIPNSVTNIGDYAFYGCSGLVSITIPNSVTTIGDEAFNGCCRLTSITIPNSVISIGGGAFGGCSGLTSIKVASSNYTYDSRGNCNAIIETASNSLFLGCINTIIPNSVTTIGNAAFADCSHLTSITIPNSVTSIGYAAFYGCSSLTSIIIPNPVTDIGNSAFYGCSGLTSIIIPNSVTTIGYRAFSQCSGLTDIYSLALVPPSVSSYYTFYDCYGATLYVPYNALENYSAADYWNDFTNIDCITFEIDNKHYRVMDSSTVSVIANNDEGILYSGDVVIPDSVTYEGYTFAVTGIENNAFDGCFELTSITIPNSVETIGEQAFQGCTGLKSVTIGSGVTAIGAKAFNYCNALETVKCLGTVPPVMASADCFTTTAYNRATLLVPRNTEATYSTTDYWYKFAHIDGWGSAGIGDVNGDGVMSILDVTSLIDVLLGNELDSFYFDSADLNSNGRLDIGDVTTLIDNLLNGDY